MTNSPHQLGQFNLSVPLFKRAICPSDAVAMPVADSATNLRREIWYMGSCFYRAARDVH